MGNWFSKNFKAIIYVSFLVPIITVAIVSISHVTQWYGLSNPISWAVYLSIGIEIAALSALAAISAQMGSKVYIPFGIVTLIQFVGNIFFAFEFIKISSVQFLSWVELVGPILEYVGIDATDLQAHRRFLAIFSGGMLPLISLSFLHMLVKFSEENKKSTDSEVEKIPANDLVAEISRVRPTEDDLERINEILNKTKPEEPKKHPTKEEREELLKEIIRLDEELGLYDEPTSTPQTASEMIITTDQDIIDSIPSDDEPSEMDLIDEDIVPYGAWDETVPEPFATDEDLASLEEHYNREDEFDEDHALDQVLNEMVEDFDDYDVEITPMTYGKDEEIKSIDVVLDELPQNLSEFDVDVDITQPTPSNPNYVIKELEPLTNQDITEESDIEKKK